MSDLKNLKEEALKAINDVKDVKVLEELKLEYLSKKGKIQSEGSHGRATRYRLTQQRLQTTHATPPLMVAMAVFALPTLEECKKMAGMFFEKPSVRAGISNKLQSVT